MWRTFTCVAGFSFAVPLQRERVPDKSPKLSWQCTLPCMAPSGLSAKRANSPPCSFSWFGCFALALVLSHYSTALTPLLSGACPTSAMYEGRSLLSCCMQGTCATECERRCHYAMPCRQSRDLQVDRERGAVRMSRQGPGPHGPNAHGPWVKGSSEKESWILSLATDQTQQHPVKQYDTLRLLDVNFLRVCGVYSRDQKPDRGLPLALRASMSSQSRQNLHCCVSIPSKMHAC